MTREMFLKELRIALEGQISQSEVNEQLRYYENYIMEESRKGKTQEQVITELGNPRLIAKTIIETSSQTGDQRAFEYEKEQQESDDQKGFHINYDEQTGWDIRYGKFKINSWYGYLLLGIIMIFLLVLLAKIAAVLIPILIPLLLAAVLLYLLFYGNRK